MPGIHRIVGWGLPHLPFTEYVAPVSMVLWIQIEMVRNIAPYLIVCNVVFVMSSPFDFAQGMLCRDIRLRIASVTLVVSQISPLRCAPVEMTK